MIFTSRNWLFDKLNKQNRSKGETCTLVNESLAMKAGRDTCERVFTLASAPISIPFEITELNTTDKDMVHFLFTLGCYKGETITLISKLAQNFVVTVKDARYSIDAELAQAIIVKDIN